MSILSSASSAALAIAQSPLLNLVSWAFPQAAPIIAIAQRYAPTIEAAQPAIVKAIEAGAPVFDAAVAAAPRFAKAVAEILHQLPQPSAAGLQPGTINKEVASASSAIAIENVSRMLGGFKRMTFEEELAYMNAMTPGNDPSQENSKFTIG